MWATLWTYELHSKLDDWSYQRLKIITTINEYTNKLLKETNKAELCEMADATMPSDRKKDLENHNITVTNLKDIQATLISLPRQDVFLGQSETILAIHHTYILASLSIYSNTINHLF